MGILDILVVVVDIEVDDDHGPLCELEVVVLGPLADQRHRVLLDELQDLLVGGGLLAQVEGAVLVGGMVDLGYVDRYRLGRHLELLRDGGIDGVKEPKTERKNGGLLYNCVSYTLSVIIHLQGASKVFRTFILHII